MNDWWIKNYRSILTYLYCGVFRGLFCSRLSWIFYCRTRKRMVSHLYEFSNGSWGCPSLWKIFGKIDVGKCTSLLQNDTVSHVKVISTLCSNICHNLRIGICRVVFLCVSSCDVSNANSIWIFSHIHYESTRKDVWEYKFNLTLI